jgi:hypothetical protein
MDVLVEGIRVVFKETIVRRKLRKMLVKVGPDPAV